MYILITIINDKAQQYDYNKTVFNNNNNHIIRCIEHVRAVTLRSHFS